MQLNSHASYAWLLSKDGPFACFWETLSVLGPQLKLSEQRDHLLWCCLWFCGLHRLKNVNPSYQLGSFWFKPQKGKFVFTWHGWLLNLFSSQHGHLLVTWLKKHIIASTDSKALPQTHRSLLSLPHAKHLDNNHTHRNPKRGRCWRNTTNSREKSVKFIAAKPEAWSYTSKPWTAEETP